MGSRINDGTWPTSGKYWRSYKPEPGPQLPYVATTYPAQDEVVDTTSFNTDWCHFDFLVRINIDCFNSPIDLAEVIIKVDGVTAFENSAFVYPHDGSRSAYSTYGYNGYSFTIEPKIRWDGGTGSIYVYMRTDALVSAEKTITYNKGGGTECYIEQIIDLDRDISDLSFYGNTFVFGDTTDKYGYVYTRTDTTWSKQASLRGDNVTADAYSFGDVVSLWDDYAVIKSTQNAASQDYVHFFHRDNSIWTEKYVLKYDPAGDGSNKQFDNFLFNDMKLVIEDDSYGVYYYKYAEGTSSWEIQDLIVDAYAGNNLYDRNYTAFDGYWFVTSNNTGSDTTVSMYPYVSGTDTFDDIGMIYNVKWSEVSEIQTIKVRVASDTQIFQRYRAAGDNTPSNLATLTYDAGAATSDAAWSLNDTLEDLETIGEMIMKHTDGYNFIGEYYEEPEYSLCAMNPKIRIYNASGSGFGDLIRTISTSQAWFLTQTTDETTSDAYGNRLMACHKSGVGILPSLIIFRIGDD